jgi:hypothetical protein
MKKEPPEAFRPHLGLTRIELVDQAPDHEELPADSRLHPIDTAVEARLRLLLQAETFDAMILDAVRPGVFDRDVLAPSRFHQLRERITTRLVEMQATTRSPEAAAELAAAVEILHRRATEHELGEALRYALLKG